MRSAKIKGTRVLDVVDGAKPEGYVDVIIKWSAPTEYPEVFYTKGSNAPIVTVEGDEVHENWTFTLKSVEEIKEAMYTIQEEMRWEMQIGDVDVGGNIITLRDRNDAVNIAAFGPTANNYKNKRKDWTRTPSNIEIQKDAILAHVQVAYDWEEAQNALVEAMTTVDELETYFNSL